MNRLIIPAILFFIVTLFSCAEVKVEPAVECTAAHPNSCIKDIKVNDESVSDSGETIEISTAADAEVKWKYVDYDGYESSDSETISAFNISDGDTWTVYASYVDY